MRESELQKSFTRWLDFQGIVWWRMPLGPVVHTLGKRFFFKKNPLKGFPDFAGLCTQRHIGRLWVVELKHPKTGRLSDEQREWRDKLKNAGAFYAEVRTIEEAAKFFNELGEVRFISLNI